jgi:hypothetical protein
MDEYESLSHTKWDCKYHVIFIPKCRRRTIYVELRPHLGQVFRRLAQQKESRIEEGHLLADHVHMFDSAEICGVAGGWLHQGEECDPASLNKESSTVIGNGRPNKARHRALW